MKFLGAKVNDDYNNGMNNVVLQISYVAPIVLTAGCTREEWWWAIWMWGVQLLLVNAYVLYKTAHLLI